MMISRPLTSGKNMMSIMTVIIMPIDGIAPPGPLPNSSPRPMPARRCRKAKGTAFPRCHAESHRQVELKKGSCSWQQIEKTLQLEL